MGFPLSRFCKTGQGWTRQTGSDFGVPGIIRVAPMGNGYAYCPTLTPDMDFSAIRVGFVEAALSVIPEGCRVWYMRTDGGEARVIAVTPDGNEIELN